MPVEWSLTIIALSLLVLTVFATLFLWQARKTAQSVESAIKSIEAKLPAILSRLEELLESALISSHNLESQFASLAVTVARIKGISDFIFGYETLARRILKSTIKTFIKNSDSVRKGVMAFLTEAARPGR